MNPSRRTVVSSGMKQLLSVAVVAAILAGLPPASAVHAAAHEARAGNVKVTLHYKGKGTVDSSHKLWVWLFDTPNISAQSQPIDQISLDKNGADAVFQGVMPSQVWLAVAFDEQGAMTGNEPPPSGSPIGIWSGGQPGPPAAITPGDTAVITLTFDDSIRMP